MDFILKFNVDIAHENSRISRRQIDLGVSCNLTLDEMKMIMNDPDVKIGILNELQEKHKLTAIDVEIYDILEKLN